MIGNETARRIEVPGADNSRVTEEGQAGNRRALWIEAAEERIGWVIDKFLIRRVGRTKVLSVEPRRGRAEVRPEPAASAALPAWEAREAAHEVAAADGEGRRAMIKDKCMTSNHSNPVAKIVCLGVLVIAVFCALPARSRAQAPSKSESAEPSPPAQQAFASPEQAADALDRRQRINLTSFSYADIRPCRRGFCGQRQPGRGQEDRDRLRRQSSREELSGGRPKKSESRRPHCGY